MAKGPALTPAGRAQLVLRLLSREESAAELSRAAGVPENTLYLWRDEFIAAGIAQFAGPWAAAGQAARNGAAAEDASVVAVDVRSAGRLPMAPGAGVGVILPSIDTQKAMATARMLIKRAGMKATVFVVEDSARQGFIKTLNAAAARLEAKYIVYAAEDTFPGIDWLKSAHEKLERSGKGLLGFNDGKWKGRIAAFGMVRTEWVRALYAGAILFPGYKAHKADNELTLIARATDQYVYDANIVLMEVDPKKPFKEQPSDDKTLFHARFRTGFDGLVPVKKLEAFATAYMVPLNSR